MMKSLFLVIAIISMQKIVNGQTEIVKWTFPTGQLSDTVQNSSNQLNLTSTIRLEGTAPVTMTNGQATGDYAATATGWDNGADLKNWNVAFKTTGYNNVKISSKQRCGGTNGGPIDFKLQYKISNAGTWVDVSGGNVTVGNNWTTGVINNIDLPAECQDQSDFVYLRWIMTSNNNYGGGNLTANGVSKIDEIIVTGNVYTEAEKNDITDNFSILINSSNGIISIYTGNENGIISIYNITGLIIFKQKSAEKNTVIYPDKFQKGIYLVNVKTDNKIATKKIFVE